MNLNPKQSIDECLRLYNLCQKTPLGIIVNLKMVKDYHAERVHKYRLDFANAGFHHIINTQVLAHKREYALVAFKA